MPYDAETFEHDLESLLQGVRTTKRPPTTSPEEDAALAPLRKALGGTLPADMTLAKARALGQAVIRLFGVNGGQQVRWDPKAAITLKLCGRLSAHEADRWQQTNRLPDHIKLF